MKINVFWDLMPCCLVDRYESFEGAYFIHLQDSKNWGCRFLLNFDNYLPSIPKYMMSFHKTVILTYNFVMRAMI
jgi:hypothetical protein